MKARVKSTSEIVEVIAVGDYINEFGQIIGDPDYWTRLEHTYAGMAMLGMLSNEYAHKLYLDNKNYPNGLLNDSIAIAHALVEKMKEKEEK